MNSKCIGFVKTGESTADGLRKEDENEKSSKKKEHICYIGIGNDAWDRIVVFLSWQPDYGWQRYGSCG